MRKVPGWAEHDKQRDTRRCPTAPGVSVRVSVFLLKAAGAYEGCSDRVGRLRFVKKATPATKDEPSQVCVYSWPLNNTGLKIHT